MCAERSLRTLKKIISLFDIWFLAIDFLPVYCSLFYLYCKIFSISHENQINWCLVSKGIKPLHVIRFQVNNFPSLQCMKTNFRLETSEGHPIWVWLTLRIMHVVHVTVCNWFHECHPSSLSKEQKYQHSQALAFNLILMPSSVICKKVPL